MAARSRDGEVSDRWLVGYRLAIAVAFTLLLVAVGPALELGASALAFASVGGGLLLGIAHLVLQERVELALTDRKRFFLLLGAGVLLGVLTLLVVPSAFYPALSQAIIGYMWGAALVAATRYLRLPVPVDASDG